MLVGRDAERAEIDALLEDARRGRSRVLVLTGEAGIGKTALIEYARTHAVGMQVLSATAVEAESSLPYAGLHALLHPIVDSVAGLPERQARALASALALEDADESDRLASSAGVLTVFDHAASDRPLLVVIDDAHWLDRETADVLAFVGRRIAGIDLAVIASVRDGAASTFDGRQFPTLEVGPLSDDQSRELLRSRHGDRITADGVRAVVAVAGGNPLALVELPQTLSSEQLSGLAPIEEPLPLSERIEISFLGRAARLPSGTRRALLVAAAGAGVSLDAIRRAAVAIHAGELEPAETAGLVMIDAEAVRFVHPLLRSAIYQDASVAERRRAHRAVAAELADQPDLQAWHFALAADGPDEAAAAALEATAERALSRGGHAARARALERAAELSPMSDDRARRMCAAAQAAFWAGDSAHAIALCQRTLPLVDDPLVRADLVHQLGAVAGWQEGSYTAPDLADEAARVEDLDPDRAYKLLILLWNKHWGNLDFADVESLTHRIEGDLLHRLGPWWRPRALAAIAEARVAAGDSSGARRYFDEVVATDLIAASTSVQALIWVERYDDAGRALGASLELGESDGNLLRVAWSKGGYGILELALGRLGAARSQASDALELSRSLDVGFLVALSLVTLATIDALQGQDESCREHAREAAARAPEAWNDDQRLSARLALGALESSHGRYEAVLAELEPVHARVLRSGLVEPSLFPYQPDLVEAYVKLGRTDEARDVLDRFEEQATAVTRRWALAAVARCRGLLADADELDVAFGLALERHQDVPSQLERARTELAFGERLRRSNRRRDARPHLRAALEAFDAAGAEPWSERTRAELRATGERVARRDRDGRESLTPQELQIATLVAQGLTNREIGAQIFLSPKTVEYHLTHVYRKLDLHSRADLIRQFAATWEREAAAAT